MAHLSPVKPPRGVKYGKDTGSGLLVTVIKSLDSSETLEERQKEKQKIEREFKKTDVRLNELVAEHDGDLAKVMTLFGQVSTKISTSRSQINHVKTNLYECKKLLRCRRDELQKLWSEAMQQKYVADMLGQIADLRKVTSIVQGFITKKQYLHATKSLNDGVQLANGPLSPIEGLSDVRLDLEQRANQLYGKLIEELNKHIYQMSTAETLSNFHRHGSTRNSNFSPAATGGGTSSPFQRNGGVRRSAERVAANQKMRKVLVELTAQGNNFDLYKSDFIDNADLLDEDVLFFIVVECIAQLKQLPEAVENIKATIDSELKAVVHKTSAHMVAIRPNLVATELTHLQHPLLELLELLHSQFKIVAASHALLQKHFLSASQRHAVADVKLYSNTDFWAQAQSVLQAVLTDYLDIQNTSSVEVSSTASGFVEQSTNINSFFGRRKQQPKKALFKFDKSSVMHSEEPHQQEASQGDKEHKRNVSDISNELKVPAAANAATNGPTKHAPMICTPDASLLRIIYVPLIGYVHEIEVLLKQKSSCSLRSFIESYVRDTFLAKGHSRTLELTIDGLAKNHDAWRTIITPDEMKSLGLSRPLLQSTVLFERRITETKQLIEDLPDYSDELLKMVCKLLKTYRETCQAAYRGIVQPETEDKRIYSVAWLKDDDITRFLKTLPNWTDLKTSGQQARLEGSAKASLKNMASEDESPTQVQQRNIREAEMLTSNLGEGGISHHEILSEISVLKELAIMQESMEWFSYRISDFANDLRQPTVGHNESVQIKDGTIKVLTNLALEFDELANTCLLVLHLEVRVQCFHYLKENSSDKHKNTYSKSNESLEPDLKVLKLTKVLSEMEEAMMATLHPRKTKYIFEGLAHLAAKILINAANLMVSIDQAGVQRMCRNALSLKQTLGSITSSRETALDHTIAFYEMFYKDPQEILTQIIERGANYSEMQYLNVLQLACKSRNITDSNTIVSYQQQLCDILGTKPKLVAGADNSVVTETRTK